MFILPPPPPTPLKGWFQLNHHPKLPTVDCFFVVIMVCHYQHNKISNICHIHGCSVPLSSLLYPNQSDRELVCSKFHAALENLNNCVFFCKICWKVCLKTISISNFLDQKFSALTICNGKYRGSLSSQMVKR